MTQNVSEPTEQAATSEGASRLVPVGESIKYRRRAQQAEGRLQELEGQIKSLQEQLEHRDKDLGLAEAQRDEARHQLITAENRSKAERMLGEAGAVDIEAASLLLSKRVDFGEELDAESLARRVEQLLLDKPFLRGGPAGALPPKTASGKPSGTTGLAQLTRAADRAVASGDRRDVADYLRLRRAAARSAKV
jgi:TolA-binding protein